MPVYMHIVVAVIVYNSLLVVNCTWVDSLGKSALPSFSLKNFNATHLQLLRNIGTICNTPNWGKTDANYLWLHTKL